jgi:UDP-N-acetylmuramyl pentapeptide phosphotransferase/UDP-N-acetylglucosamine-1-phosphate transferase
MKQVIHAIIALVWGLGLLSSLDGLEIENNPVRVWWTIILIISVIIGVLQAVNLTDETAKQNIPF